jgi:hypothetical protein
LMSPCFEKIIENAQQLPYLQPFYCIPSSMLAKFKATRLGLIQYLFSRYRITKQLRSQDQNQQVYKNLGILVYHLATSLTVSMATAKIPTWILGSENPRNPGAPTLDLWKMIRRYNQPYINRYDNIHGAIILTYGGEEQVNISQDEQNEDEEIYEGNQDIEELDEDVDQWENFMYLGPSHWDYTVIATYLFNLFKEDMWKAVPQKYYQQDSCLWTYNSIKRSVRNAEFKTLVQVRIDKTWEDRFHMYFDANRNMEQVTQCQGWGRVMYLKRYCEMVARAGDHIRDLIDQQIWEDFQQLEVIIYSERNGKFMVSRGHPKFLCKK